MPHIYRVFLQNNSWLPHFFPKKCIILASFMRHLHLWCSLNDTAVVEPMDRFAALVSILLSSPPTATSSGQTRNYCSLHTTHIWFASQRWHDLGMMPSNKVQYQCYFVSIMWKHFQIMSSCPVLPHAVLLGWCRDCFRVPTIYYPLSTQYLPCP